MSVLCLFFAYSGFMARCGCDATGGTTCEVIVLCVGDHLSYGLLLDKNGRLDVFASNDSGNQLEVRPTGIYVPQGTIQPWEPETTVADLPDSFIYGEEGGIYRYPRGSFRSFQDCFEYGFPIWEGFSYATADGVAVWGATGAAASFQTTTDNTSLATWGNISSSNYQATVVDAGTRESPTGRLTGAFDEFLVPDGGFRGFFAEQFMPAFLSDALRECMGRRVMSITLGQPVTQTENMRNVQAIIRDIEYYNAQSWTMVFIPGFNQEDPDATPQLVPADLEEMAAPLRDAGINIGVNLVRETETARTGGVVIPVQDMVDAGAQWVRAWGLEAPLASSQARLEELANAGLTVIALIPGRHSQVSANRSIGITRFACDDPVYAAGVDPENRSYRTGMISPLDMRMNYVGELTTRDRMGRAESRRGFSLLDNPGRFYNYVFWGRPNSTDIRWDFPSVLVGQVDPVTSSTSYVLRWRQMWREAPQTGTGHVDSRQGVYFALADDRDFAVDSSGTDDSSWTGYLVDLFYLASFDTVIARVFRSDGTTRTQLVSDSFGSLVNEQWAEFTVTVTATDFRVQVNYGPDSFDQVFTDATYRGSYVSMLVNRGTGVQGDGRSTILGWSTQGPDVPFYEEV